jgi:GNAT superfamily N-acetyltransferase
VITLIQYRKANIRDIDNLVKLRIQFLKEIGSMEPSEKDNILEKSLYDYFNESITKDEFAAWLAIDNEKIVATSGVSFYMVPPSFKNITGKVAYIMNMYTISDYRRQGIAAILFEKIINEAKDRGYNRITLNATNQGRPLYEKFGFKELSNEMELNI